AVGWMPVVDDGVLRFIAGCDPTLILDERGAVVGESSPPAMAERYRGATQAIAFDGGWLALVREAASGAPVSTFVHRFVWLDCSLVLRRVSRPFYFDAKGLERAGGLAWHPNGRDLLVSYVGAGGSPRVASAGADDIERFLGHSQRRPFDVD
ncbi:hypothetical protein, partial [Reyranella sp.]|uniref:hypothetical protein n=1 Tax=Reyranella sp. TaxID=1929291 RepID=UPI003D11423E